MTQMTIPHNIMSDIQSLPSEAQSQVFDFVEFLKSKYKKPKNISKTNTLSIDDAFGMITAKKSVSLEEMQEAIETCGGKL